MHPCCARAASPPPTHAPLCFFACRSCGSWVFAEGGLGFAKCKRRRTTRVLFTAARTLACTCARAAVAAALQQPQCGACCACSAGRARPLQAQPRSALSVAYTAREGRARRDRGCCAAHLLWVARPARLRAAQHLPPRWAGRDVAARLRHALRAADSASGAARPALQTHTSIAAARTCTSAPAHCTTSHCTGTASSKPGARSAGVGAPATCCAVTITSPACLSARAA